VLYAMVAGYLPFEEHKSAESENLLKFYTRVVRGSLEFHPKMSRGLRDLLSSMLDPDASKRPTVHEIYTHPWLYIRDKIL
jgi:serine/threonine protein kinase